MVHSFIIRTWFFCCCRHDKWHTLFWWMSLENIQEMGPQANRFKQKEKKKTMRRRDTQLGADTGDCFKVFQHRDYNLIQRERNFVCLFVLMSLLLLCSLSWHPMGPNLRTDDRETEKKPSHLSPPLWTRPFGCQTDLSRKRGKKIG